MAFDSASDENRQDDNAKHTQSFGRSQVQCCKLAHAVKSAWDLLCWEKESRCISTSSQELDFISGGGIHLKEVTEICGVPGIGKTQLGIQLAINVQISRDLDGVGGHAIYIDTEGSFMVERALQIAQACVAAVNCRISKCLMNPELLLSNIHYFRICDPAEQVALVDHLECLLEEHKQIKLVVIDSIAFHFRHGFEDMSLRTRILGSMGQKFVSLAGLHDVAIVLMNQVTTTFSGGFAKLVPALGENWSHVCTNRLILYWKEGHRYAHIFKSPFLPSATTSFNVSSEGLHACFTNKKLKTSCCISN